MRRVAASLLTAYAAAATVAAAWLGCRAFALQRIFATFFRMRSGGAADSMSYDEILSLTGAHQNMTGPVDSATLAAGSASPAQVAAVAGMVFVGCLALAAVRRRNTKTSPEPTPPKD